MAALLRFRVEKLIRDHVAAQLRARGIELHERQLNACEYEASLRAKLLEEASEVVRAATPTELEEELGDLSEVILALCEMHGLTAEQVESTRRAKSAAKGGFAERIYSSAVVMAADNPAASYYLERPSVYPRLEPPPLALHFDRRSDHLRYRFFLCSGSELTALAWQREDARLWVRCVPIHGWAVLDADSCILAQPWPLGGSSAAVLPPTGKWVSQLGDNAYVYDLTHAECES